MLAFSITLVTPNIKTSINVILYSLFTPNQFKSNNLFSKDQSLGSLPIVFYSFKNKIIPTSLCMIPNEIVYNIRGAHNKLFLVRPSTHTPKTNNMINWKNKESYSAKYTVKEIT